jgi:hypothetical protein
MAACLPHARHANHRIQREARPVRRPNRDNGNSADHRRAFFAVTRRGSPNSIARSNVMSPQRLLLIFLVCASGVASAQTQSFRFPSEASAVKAIAEAGFFEQPRQIPATVIDVGTLRFVPYVSYRVGEDREVNIYGDLESPACVEIGLYKALRNSAEEKQKCLALMKRLFPQMDLSSLRPSGGKSMKAGAVAEITPPDAPDSYDGWWVSVYNLDLLHKARGTSATVSVVSVPASQSTANAEWSPSELSYARGASSGAFGSGRVYVRSYVRKDGTYVRAHSRSK